MILPPKYISQFYFLCSTRVQAISFTRIDATALFTSFSWLLLPSSHFFLPCLSPATPPFPTNTQDTFLNNNKKWILSLPSLKMLKLVYANACQICMTQALLNSPNASLVPSSWSSLTFSSGLKTGSSPHCGWIALSYPLGLSKNVISRRPFPKTFCNSLSTVLVSFVSCFKLYVILSICLLSVQTLYGQRLRVFHTPRI